MGYVQHAQGEFSIEVAGEKHCGPNHDSPKRFSYEVDIHYPDEALDENGFLLDNLHFKQYFNALDRTELSCELLVRKVAHELMDATEKRAHLVDVALWAIANYAKVQYRLEGGKG